MSISQLARKHFMMAGGPLSGPSPIPTGPSVGPLPAPPARMGLSALARTSALGGPQVPATPAAVVARKVVSFADPRATLEEASRPSPSRAPYGGGEVARQAKEPWSMPAFSLSQAVATPVINPDVQPSKGWSPMG